MRTKQGQEWGHSRSRVVGGWGCRCRTRSCCLSHKHTHAQHSCRRARANDSDSLTTNPDQGRGGELNRREERCVCVSVCLCERCCGGRGRERGVFRSGVRWVAVRDRGGEPGATCRRRRSSETIDQWPCPPPLPQPFWLGRWPVGRQGSRQR